MSNIRYPKEMVFGLDIGTRNLVGMVGFRENEHMFRVVAHKVLEHDTRAMMDGQIHDIAKVSESIATLKRQLEEETGSKLEDVCIAAAGRVLKTITVNISYDLTTETVIKNEHVHALEMLGVEKAYDMIRTDSTQSKINFYCVGYSVIRYYLNDYPISTLEEHKANKISADLIATFLPEEVIDGLYSSVQSAGLQVSNLTLEPIAAINVAIPQKYRLLNIALVDVGAGTSDICITKDGSIIAYGMIPYAGDELTEKLAEHFLVEFNEAERIKQISPKKKTVTYTDILRIKHKVLVSEVFDTVEETVSKIAEAIADKIQELNGGKSVSAVFIVGGGGKIPGFTEQIASFLKIPKERVALRGEEVLGDVEFLQEGVKKDPLLVTPIGICMSYYDKKNNFIYVNVNGERIKLYDNSKLTIVDAALQTGYPNEQLFPQRGKPIQFHLNGTKRMIRGESGEAAVIRLNGKETSISASIESNDQIEIISSTSGADAKLKVEELREYHDSISFLFNGKNIICPKFVTVNGTLESGYYQIQDNDEVEILNYYTLEQVLLFMDVEYNRNILVNHVAAKADTKVYENFSIDYNIEEKEALEEQLKMELEKPNSSSNEIDCNIIVNKTPITLKNKTSYILVDVLDFYPFDLSVLKGNGLLILINGIETKDFSHPIHEGDVVELGWK